MLAGHYEMLAKTITSLAGLMKPARGTIDSGIADLASNPKHLAGFGRNDRRHR